MLQNVTRVFLLFTIFSLFTSCKFTTSDAQRANNKPLFVATKGILPTEDRARRKWDGALVADFDQNGFQDVMLTDHAHRITLYWNEKGQFSAPQVLTLGDMHGQAIADIDGNGMLDVLVSQGGGNGGNPRKPKLFTLSNQREISQGIELAHFENNRGRSIKAFDANNDGWVDLYLTGFATPKQMAKGANHLYRNQQGKFEFVDQLPFSDRLNYKSIIIDYNQDGVSDVLTFGGKTMVLAKGEGNYHFSDVTQSALGKNKRIHDVSAIAQIDYDSDGDFDLVLSRAEHQFEHEVYADNANHRLAFFARFTPLLLDELIIDGDLMLENLQMAFPHSEVFLGAKKTPLFGEQSPRRVYSFDQDINGKLDFTITPEQAMGWPSDLCPSITKVSDFPQQPKPGLYIGYVGDNTWHICSQTKSPTTAVIHNVRSKHQTRQDNPLPVVVLENRNGVFHDVTTALGIDISEQTTSVVAADMNNDGWSDLFFVRYGNMATQNQQIVYINQQGKGFTRLAEHGVISTELGATGSGAEGLDFDRDGDIDLLYANERGKWHLFENTTQGKHFIAFSIAPSPESKATQLGALVEIDACGRKQTQIVGNGSSSFGTSLNNHIHFGLGQCNKVDAVSVRWSNGENKHFVPKQVDRYFSL